MQLDLQIPLETPNRFGVGPELARAGWFCAGTTAATKFAPYLQLRRYG
jgi:hypothetical protein